jgi:hypothetical protein
MSLLEVREQTWPALGITGSGILCLSSEDLLDLAAGALARGLDSHACGLVRRLLPVVSVARR